MALAAQREWLKGFIELYRSEPCLWKIKSKEYHDRSKKDAAYERMILKLRELEPTANRETVIKKINNIRCTYKKEYKKVIASMNGSDDIYEPKLWYFSLLSFLDSQDMSRNSTTEADTVYQIETLKLSDGSSGSSGYATDTTVLEDNCYAGGLIKTRDSTETLPSATTFNDSINLWSPKINPESPLAKDVIFSVSQIQQPTQQEDRFDVIGKLVTLKLRTLKKEQALFAEKIINETLFEAELGNLTSSYKIRAPEIPVHSPARLCSRCDGTFDLPLPVLEYQSSYNSAWGHCQEDNSKQSYD